MTPTVCHASPDQDGRLVRCGVVVIGRNEGERLIRCLRSVRGVSAAVVYVDSGSTDRSTEAAREAGAEVVQLDTSVPFTAARARNAGLRHLVQRHPDLTHVQFVDGDCEVVAGWLDTAGRALNARPDVAVVCGRRRERYPQQSRYNRLCDMEWDTPVGEAEACGGDALFAIAPFTAVGGYRESLIAGEEPELCARLRAGGWKVLRIDAEMTIHDAAMTRFGQWWRRSVRCGYGYAAVGRLTRGASGLWQKELLSNWLWGLLMPVVGLTGITSIGLILGPGSAALFALFAAGYPLQVFRVYRHRRRHGNTPADARLYATFCVLSKFPQAVGQLRYVRDWLSARPSHLIEYKVADQAIRPQVAYLVNQYPHPRHTFIRREILALEGLGWQVMRVTVRRAIVDLPDPTDRAELARTRALLEAGLLATAYKVMITAALSPISFVRAVFHAVRLGRRSGRPTRQFFTWLKPVSWSTG